METALVTGSSGLVGSEMCRMFGEAGFKIYGVDNHQRALFFGESADTRWNQKRLEKTLQHYQHIEEDVRNRDGILKLVEQIRPAVVIHSAGQPSHDRAAEIPFEDFETNATSTLNLLEAVRRFCPESPFIHMSTNKVYGDRPNTVALRELEKRWDYADSAFEHGIPEHFSTDQSLHSLFGVSKLASDALVQEYGRYFNIPTCCLRAGCLTGPAHAGVELHGFLSYLVKCNMEGREYRIYGYKGKQVRDNLHAEDVARFALEFYRAPRVAEVYNLGGGKENACSILEAFEMAESLTGKTQKSVYLDQPRKGDHICYYSDLRKIRSHYPNWQITKPLPATLEEVVRGWKERL